ncbi:MAG: hypothetical protein ACM337_06180 [Syntrophaceae bacterium]
MENNDRLVSLMKKAVELVQQAQVKRKELREGNMSDAEASQFLRDNAMNFNEVQRQIKEEMGKRT